MQGAVWLLNAVYRVLSFFVKLLNYYVIILHYISVIILHYISTEVVLWE